MPRPTKTPVSKRADLDARLKERDVKRANGRTRKHSRPPIRFLDIVAEEDLIAAMQGTYGIVTKIAANLEKKFRVPMNWSTVYEHITLNKNTHAAFLAEREKALRHFDRAGPYAKGHGRLCHYWHRHQLLPAAFRLCPRYSNNRRIIVHGYRNRN